MQIYLKEFLEEFLRKSVGFIGVISYKILVEIPNGICGGILEEIAVESLKRIQGRIAE